GAVHALVLQVSARRASHRRRCAATHAARAREAFIAARVGRVHLVRLARHRALELSPSVFSALANALAYASCPEITVPFGAVMSGRFCRIHPPLPEETSHVP